MTSEEFKGFCESFYGCYGENVDLEEGDKFEIRLKNGEVLVFSKDNVCFCEHGETSVLEIINYRTGSKYYHEFIPASEISRISVIESSPVDKNQVSW